MVECRMYYYGLRGDIHGSGKGRVMGKYRQDRINDSVTKEMSQIVREIKDPRVASALITVTGAEVSQDLKYAKIFYSSITGESEETARGLASAAGFARSALAKRLNMRTTPEIKFVYDSSLEHGMKIAKILNELEITDEAEADDETKDGDE